MSYIQPNSTIEFFSDLNLSQDYNDSLYFETAPLRDIYFTNLPKLAVADRCYYARDNRGFVRVELPIGTMMHAQYMRFKNTSYENNWWYAFVQDVIYINDHTVEVQFELDPLMSYMGEFTLNSCFVERQHSETDEFGDNLVDEPFACGEYENHNGIVASSSAQLACTGWFNSISEHEYSWKYNEAWCYMVFYVPPSVVADPVKGNLGVYSGLDVKIFPNNPTGIAEMDAFLHTVQILANIQAVVLVPEAFIPNIPNYEPPYSGAPDYSSGRTAVPYIKTQNLASPLTDVWGINPKNKKIYTYPYNFLAVWNSEDKENIYRYELFSNPLSISFEFTGSYGEKTEIGCYPLNYREMAKNYAEGCSMKNFPLATWVSDMFMAYMAQTLSSAPQALGRSGNAFGVTESNLFGGGKLGTFSAGNTDITVTKPQNAGWNKINATIANELAKDAGHMIQPNEAHSGTPSDVITLSNKKDFYFFRRTIKPEFAKRIDDYWTMFGYPDGTVHVPNMNARTRFTYVKTIGCKLNCACPASDADFIEQLFNKGIRFWKNHLDIGNYSSPNPPITTNEGE